MFPVEIWEDILKHVDPVDLGRLRVVCKSWDLIVSQVYKQTDLWYKKCISKVPEELWSSILEHQHGSELPWQDFHQARDNPNVWMGLYKSWMNWRKLLKKQWILTTYSPIPEHRLLEHVTCTAVLNNIIAVGTTEGFMTFYDIQGTTEYFIDHAEFIQDVQLWRNGANQIIATSSFVYGRINHWNLIDRVLEDRSRGTLISASFQYCFMLKRNNVINIQRPGMSDCNSKDDKSILLVNDRFELPEFDRFIAIGADRQEVILWTEGSTHCKVNTTRKNSTCEEVFVNPPQILIRCYRIFKPCVIACIGELGEFGFSINSREWKIYKLFRQLHAPVTAILFHVAVLVLGLGSGEIYIFAIEDVDCLDRLNFKKMQFIKLTLDTQAIISLNAMECNSTQYLVAATNKKVHLVKFL